LGPHQLGQSSPDHLFNAAVGFVMLGAHFWCAWRMYRKGWPLRYFALKQERPTLADTTISVRNILKFLRWHLDDTPWSTHWFPAVLSMSAWLFFELQAFFAN